MKLSDQCCSIEQAKKLKELGVEQKGFWLYEFEEGNYPKNELWNLFPLRSCDAGQKDFSAFTVAELGVMLPTNPVPNGRISYSYYHRNNWKGHSVGYSAPADPSNHIERAWFEKEAEARADLLIHLLESKLITASQVNERLK